MKIKHLRKKKLEIKLGVKMQNITGNTNNMPNTKYIQNRKSIPMLKDIIFRNGIYNYYNVMLMSDFKRTFELNEHSSCID